LVFILDAFFYKLNYFSDCKLRNFNAPLQVSGKLFEEHGGLKADFPFPIAEPGEDHKW